MRSTTRPFSAKPTRPILKKTTVKPLPPNSLYSLQLSFVTTVTIPLLQYYYFYVCVLLYNSETELASWNKRPFNSQRLIYTSWTQPQTSGGNYNSLSHSFCRMMDLLALNKTYVVNRCSCATIISYCNSYLITMGSYIFLWCFLIILLFFVNSIMWLHYLLN